MLREQIVNEPLIEGTLVANLELVGLFDEFLFRYVQEIPPSVIQCQFTAAKFFLPPCTTGPDNWTCAKLQSR